MKSFPLILMAGVLGFGCSSAKPPKPVPAPVAGAERSASEAPKWWSAGNGRAAAGQWQSALDRYRLLNDRPNEALALHNLAEAKQQLGELKAAHSLLESAAAINAALKLDGRWWRD